MFLRVLIVILGLIIIGCGSETSKNNTYDDFEASEKLYQAGRKMGIHHLAKPDLYIDDRLADIAKEFEKDLGRPIKDVGIQVTHGDTPTCTNFGLLGYKIVYFPVDMLEWEYELKRIVLYHELGHCVLIKFHNKCNDINIMCSTLSFDDMLDISEDWEYYKRRLFQ